MHKKRFVVFNATTARILVNPENGDELEKMPNVVVNPNLEAVKGIPPHLWKLQDGKVLPMSKGEQEKRLQLIEKHGIDNSPPVTIIQKVYRYHEWYVAPICFALGAGLGALLAAYLF